MTASPSTSAVLFDLDGTLLDSLKDIANAMNLVLEQHGFPTHPVEDYNHHVGDGMDTLARRVLPPGEAGNTELRARIVRHMKRTYSDTWYHWSAPYPGIHDLLQTLGASPLKLGVLSNKPDEFTTVIVEHFFPLTPWAAIRGARPGIPIKPAPDAALDIAREWNLPPEQIVFVGDTSTDVLTAVNAGMPCIGVTWGFRDREELLAHGAKWIVDYPAEIPAILGLQPE
ncbi:MAG: HAD family hydrolase [Verrucomicrobia bacterium]|nr:HAD family hydrolase [Verrucomicrobiota bacterium]MCH8526653.1 HAD family hydrolase [Kiritimatiellia bacterium]